MNPPREQEGSHEALGGDGLKEHECLGWCTLAIVVDPGTGSLDESDIAQAISDLEAAGLIVIEDIMM